MRRLLLPLIALAGVALPGIASAQYYSPYYTTPYVAPGVTVTTPAPGPMVQGQVYLAPGATYVAPGQEYTDQPIIIEGRRYYRDCWWDWGQRRCELKPWR